MATFFDQERIMMICLLHISPADVVQQITFSYSELAQDFNAARFCSLVYAAASLSSAVNLDDNFAFSSLQFVYNVCTHHLNDIRIIACLIYLAMHYVRAGKISDQMLQISTQFAINGLQCQEIQRLSVDFLLSASRTTAVPGFDCNILLNLTDIKSDTYILLAEAVAYSYMHSNELERAVQVIASQWQIVQAKPVSFEFTRGLRTIMCGLIGFARANIECAVSILSSILPALQQSTGEFVQLLIKMYEEGGEISKARDDANLMILFIRYEMQLFKVALRREVF